LIAQVIANQPSWSDLPVIVLTTGGHSTPTSEARRKLREPLGNLILIERPVRPETLASTIKSAIRARMRQYQARDFLHQEKLAAEALRKSEKVAVAGRLAASIAHEINNPLEAVMNLHFLMRSADSLEVIKDYLAIADQELQRVTEITKQTLKFYRENTNPHRVNMAAVIESALQIYERRLKTFGIATDCEFEPECTVVGITGELRQVLANLISNAIDAMPRGGRLRIRLARSRQWSNGLRRGVQVLIGDTGAGIPLSVRDTILEPFVSTKQEKGTGLGLWVSAEIVRKHGGIVRYRSKIGKGTVFRVFLPVTSTLSAIQAQPSVRHAG
jgi:signal transduction histidine kinase